MAEVVVEAVEEEVVEVLTEVEAEVVTPMAATIPPQTMLPRVNSATGFGWYNFDMYRHGEFSASGDL